MMTSTVIPNELSPPERFPVLELIFPRSIAPTPPRTEASGLLVFGSANVIEIIEFARFLADRIDA